MRTDIVTTLQECSKGLSKLQKEIMAFVKKYGYITTFDAINFSLNMDSVETVSFKQASGSAYASASRSLRRLVERDLLMRVRSQYVGDSDVFISPDFTDQVPRIKRRNSELEAFKDVYTDRRPSVETLDAACKNAFKENDNG